MKQKVLFSLLILMLMSISVSAQTGGGRIAYRVHNIPMLRANR